MELLTDFLQLPVRPPREPRCHATDPFASELCNPDGEGFVILCFVWCVENPPLDFCSVPAPDRLLDRGLPEDGFKQLADNLYNSFPAPVVLSQKQPILRRYIVARQG